MVRIDSTVSTLLIAAAAAAGHSPQGVGRDRQRGLHQQRRHDVGEDVAQRHAQRRIAGGDQPQLGKPQRLAGLDGEEELAPAREGEPLRVEQGMVRLRDIFREQKIDLTAELDSLSAYHSADGIGG